MAVIECPRCGAPVHVDDQTTVRSGPSTASGEPREWIMFESGDEVHRCAEDAA